MKQEYTLVLIIGLLIAAYVLEAIVQPLGISLATPYHYISIENISTYPFTTTVIVVRALALFMTPVWILSFLDKNYVLKGSISLVLAGLSQLYALQEIATGNQILPIEWSLALAMAGIALIIPMILYYIRAMLYSAHKKLTGAKKEEEQTTKEEDTKKE